MTGGSGDDLKSSKSDEFWKKINDILDGNEDHDDQSLEGFFDPIAEENPLADSCSALAQASFEFGLYDFAEEIHTVGNTLRIDGVDEDDREEAHQEIQRIMLKHKVEIRDAMTGGGQKSLPADQFHDFLIQKNAFEAALRKVDQVFGKAARVTPKAPATPVEPTKVTEVKQSLGSRITNSPKERWNRAPNSENKSENRNSIRDRFSKLFDTGDKRNQEQRMSTKPAKALAEQPTDPKPR